MLVALFLAAAAAAVPQADLIARAAARVAVNRHSVRRYACVETIRRDFFRPVASTLPRSCSALLEQRRRPASDNELRLVATDWLRLAVIDTEAGEVHSWVGANHFDDAGIAHVVRERPIANGEFAALLGLIFLGDVKHFAFEGETVVGDRKALRYSFAVDTPDSHYKVRAVDGGEQVRVAYSGSIAIDAETADPLEVAVRTDSMPEASGSCQTVWKLDFARVNVGRDELLLPRHASHRFLALDGRETENTANFSACREYSSKSSITYFTGQEGSAEDAAKGADEVPRIPWGLRFRLELASPIDSDTAAAGDRFTARLVSPLLDGTRVLAPSGAVVEGRISKLKIYYGPAAEVVLGLSPDTLEIQGRRVPIGAMPEFPRKGRGEEITLPPPGERSGMFRRSGVRAVWPSGFVTQWRTGPEGGPGPRFP